MIWKNNENYDHNFRFYLYLSICNFERNKIKVIGKELNMLEKLYSDLIDISKKLKLNITGIILNLDYWCGLSGGKRVINAQFSNLKLFKFERNNLSVLVD